ncbi:hypothetical protein JQM66_01280 [Oscillibacter valericigenes]|uniref:DNA modification system-associated small protein n=1 Tax=Oscillibacter valericigenes TaxID=351091 RepID=UPI001F182608|nr:DNA modification system-associated small protein [Oscillibacter valericigenes]MCF2663193.1 hypothetical protein [Oscillibacter valericigenes]
MKNSLEELISTIEEIRLTKYPHISPEILTKIVEIQAAYQDDPARREAETYKAIAQYVASTKEV